MASCSCSVNRASSHFHLLVKLLESPSPHETRKCVMRGMLFYYPCCVCLNHIKCLFLTETGCFLKNSNGACPTTGNTDEWKTPKQGVMLFTGNKVNVCYVINQWGSVHNVAELIIQQQCDRQTAVDAFIASVKIPFVFPRLITGVYVHFHFIHCNNKISFFKSTSQ